MITEEIKRLMTYNALDLTDAGYEITEITFEKLCEKGIFLKSKVDDITPDTLWTKVPVYVWYNKESNSILGNILILATSATSVLHYHSEELYDRLGITRGVNISHKFYLMSIE